LVNTNARRSILKKLIFIDKFNVSGIEIHSELVLVENLLILAGAVSGEALYLAGKDWPRN
jgi:hypothetical protein